MQSYESNEIRFTLLAVIGDKKEQAEKELNRLTKIRNFLHQQLGLEHDPSANYDSVKAEI